MREADNTGVERRQGRRQIITGYSVLLSVYVCGDWKEKSGERLLTAHPDFFVFMRRHAYGSQPQMQHAGRADEQEEKSVFCSIRY